MTTISREKKNKHVSIFFLSACLLFCSSRNFTLFNVYFETVTSNLLGSAQTAAAGVSCEFKEQMCRQVRVPGRVDCFSVRLHSTNGGGKPVSVKESTPEDRHPESATTLVSKLAKRWPVLLSFPSQHKKSRAICQEL